MRFMLGKLCKVCKFMIFKCMINYDEIRKIDMRLVFLVYI